MAYSTPTKKMKYHHGDHEVCVFIDYSNNILQTSMDTSLC